MNARRFLGLSVLTVMGLLLGVDASRAGNPFPGKPMPSLVKPEVQFGKYGSALGELNEPNSLAISTKNEIYIAECYNRRIQVFDMTGHPKRMWYGSSLHKFRCPQGIAISSNGEVYIADRSGAILVYDELGHFKRSFGSYGDAIGHLVEPKNVAVSAGKVYVADSGNSRIDVFASSGKFLRTIGGSSDAERGLITPVSVAVNSLGDIFAVDAALSRIQKFSQTGQYLASWGSYGGLPGELAEPEDISFARDRLYVADTLNHRLQAFGDSGNVVLVWGRHPETAHEGYGHTHYPSSIKLSPDGLHAVVCEPFEYRCQIFGMSSVRNLAAANTSAWWQKFPRFHYGGGLRVARLPKMASVKANLLQLRAMSRQALLAQGKAADETSPTLEVPRELMIITEPDLHRVVAFSLDKSVSALAASARAAHSTSVDIPVMYSIGSFGRGNGQFLTISKKVPMADGTLLIGDAGRNDVQQFNLLTGQYLRTLFSSGTGPGQFHGPSGADVDQNGNIYIGDFHNNRIQVFDKDYNFRFQFGKLGDGPGELFGPMSLSFDPTFSKLYVSDSGNQRIDVFDPSGHFLYSFGHLTRPGEWGEGTFQWPFDLAVSAKGFIYVTDPSLQLVQKFDANGKFLLQWGGWGTEPGQFYKPKGIDVDAAGNVFVLDFGNHRGQVFDMNGKFLGIFGEGVLYPASLAPSPSPHAT